MELRDYLARRRSLVDRRLDALLPAEDTEPVPLHRAMRYAVFAGGKRIRPCLVIAGAEAAGGKLEAVLDAAAAAECIHTYSLVHDDLPAMDNDDTRRGKPALHRAFGEAVAILAGDALLTFAFEILLSPDWTRRHPSGRIIKAAAELAHAAGSRRLVGGQVQDMLSEGKPASRETVDYIVRNKTGALIRASLTSGAILAGADATCLDMIGRCGASLGAIFQIRDDILDLEGDSDALGKAVNKDGKRGKATYPGLIGLKESRELMVSLARSAQEAISPLGSRAAHLVALADYLVERTS